MHDPLENLEVAKLAAVLSGQLRKIDKETESSMPANRIDMQRFQEQVVQSFNKSQNINTPIRNPMFQNSEQARMLEYLNMEAMSKFPEPVPVQPVPVQPVPVQPVPVQPVPVQPVPVQPVPVQPVPVQPVPENTKEIQTSLNNIVKTLEDINKNFKNLCDILKEDNSNNFKKKKILNSNSLKKNI
jgi:hypothetical protein